MGLDVGWLRHGTGWLMCCMDVWTMDFRTLVYLSHHCWGLWLCSVGDEIAELADGALKAVLIFES